MFSPTVQLRSGGYIVINQTEALVAIDVNSGRSTREHHIEDTALKTNVEASEEVARQLRLRDLAGLIVIDYIDMDEKRNNRTVERRLKDALRNDRARIQVGRISHFGLMEMSRQRIRTSVLESSTEKCPHCGGTGHVRSVSSVALQLLRSIEETLLKGPTHNLIIRTRPEIALYVLNHKRAHLRGLEERFQVTLTVNSDEEVGGQIGFTIDRGEQVMTIDQAKALLAQAAAAAPALHEDEEPDFPEEVDEESDAEASEASSRARRTRRTGRRGPRQRRRSSADARRRRAREWRRTSRWPWPRRPAPPAARAWRPRRRRPRGRPVPAPSRAWLARARRSPRTIRRRASRSRTGGEFAPGDMPPEQGFAPAAPGGRRTAHQRRWRTPAPAPRTARRTAQSPRRRTGQRRFRRDPGSRKPTSVPTHSERPGLVAAARGVAARHAGADLCAADRARASAGAGSRQPQSAAAAARR